MSKLRNISLFVLLAAIAFTILDGRIPPHRALDKSISDFKAKTELHNKKYVPENYTERVTDTILSNGYRVKVKTSTDMLSQVEVHSTKNNRLQKVIFRHAILDIELQNKTFGSPINTTLRHYDFTTLDQNLVLRAAYIDEEYSLFKTDIHFKLHFLEPKSKREEIYRMQLKNDGTFTLKPEDVRT